jgi:opacity protein-like surface antigen
VLTKRGTALTSHSTGSRRCSAAAAAAAPAAAAAVQAVRCFDWKQNVQQQQNSIVVDEMYAFLLELLAGSSEAGQALQAQRPAKVGQHV